MYPTPAVARPDDTTCAAVDGSMLTTCFVVACCYVPLGMTVMVVMDYVLESCGLDRIAAVVAVVTTGQRRNIFELVLLVLPLLIAAIIWTMLGFVFYKMATDIKPMQQQLANATTSSPVNAKRESEPSNIIDYFLFFLFPCIIHTVDQVGIRFKFQCVPVKKKIKIMNW